MFLKTTQTLIFGFEPSSVSGKPLYTRNVRFSKTFDTFDFFMGYHLIS